MSSQRVESISRLSPHMELTLDNLIIEFQRVETSYARECALKGLWPIEKPTTVLAIESLNGYGSYPMIRCRGFAGSD
jgi:hypothetical protein